mgnify:CR=1 FL=1
MAWKELLCLKMASLNITQEELAELLTAEGSPVKQPAISKWVRGAAEPLPSRWVPLCRILKINRQELDAVTGLDALSEGAA